MDTTQDYVCENCGTVGRLKKSVKGNFLTELLLWCCFFIPGVIYSAWRLSGKNLTCQKCGSTKVIAADTPKGKQLIRSFAE